MFTLFFTKYGKQLSNFKLLWKTSFQLIHNLLSLIMFIFCSETVVCFIIYPIALDHTETHTKKSMNSD